MVLSLTGGLWGQSGQSTQQAFVVNTGDESVSQVDLESMKEVMCCQAMFYETNPIPVKTALNLMGKDVGEVRLPLAPLSAENTEKLVQAMEC